MQAHGGMAENTSRMQTVLLGSHNYMTILVHSWNTGGKPELIIL